MTSPSAGRAAFTAFALALIAALAPRAVPADPTIVRLGMTTEPNSLTPLFALNDYENVVDRLMFDVLVTVDGSQDDPDGDCDSEGQRPLQGGGRPRSEVGHKGGGRHLIAQRSR